MSHGLVNEPWLIAELDKLLRDQHIAERAAAVARQQRTAAEFCDNRKSIDGLGRPRLEVDDYAYHYWGQRLKTYECWKDKQFLKEFERDNEACRVKAEGTKLQVGYGSKASAATKRFSKTYQ